MTESNSNPVTRALRFAARIEPRELPAVLAAFFLYFFVLGSYFAVRPVRETIATILGAETVADLWLYTALFSIAIVPIYGWLVSKVRRSILLPAIYGSVAVVLVIIGNGLGDQEVGQSVGASFYVWISVLNLMLVSVMWSFLLEMFNSEQSKRLFGLVAAGGTAGALVGPAITRVFVSTVGDSGVLYIGAAGFVGAIACQAVLMGIWKPAAATSATAPAAPTGTAPAAATGTATAVDKGLGGNPFAGIFLVAKSPYLIGIAVFVALASLASTILYFEQLKIVEAAFPDRTERTEVFATIDFVVQSLTILTQLFLTGRIATKFGLRYLLVILPIVMMGGFLVLAAFNTFTVLVIMFVGRRWGEDALIRPGREMLFSVFDKETKYKAKKFIDVPVYRAADYVGAQAKTAIDAVTASPVASLAIVAAMAGVWATVGWRLGKRQDDAPR
jgi:AAA family ATP:ADP antiporter